MTDLPRDSAAAEPGVALYVHWPYCARICPYCDFNVVRDRGRREEQAGLVLAILSDLRAQAALMGRRPLASIFFGGGTPSLMQPEAVGAIIAEARAMFPTNAPVEMTLEANPTDAEADRFAALAQAGINRLSLGVQSLDAQTLGFLGRNHTADEARRAIALAGEAFSRLSIDLIYAHPGQTVAAWQDELRTAVGLGFEHISPYQLTLAPGTAFGRALARSRLTPPDQDLEADLYETTQSVLGQAGFEAYEVSNHARSPAARSAHNLHVWRGGDYIGVGPGAHGRLTLDGQRMATVAHRGIGPYVTGVVGGVPWSEQTALGARETAEERLLLGLRTTEGVDDSLLRSVGLTPAQAPLHDLIADGFLVQQEGRIAAMAKGRPVLDGILRALLT